MTRTLHQLLSRVLMLLVLALQPIHIAKAAENESNTYREFKALIDRYYAACNSRNIDVEMAFYAKDPGLVFYDMTGPLKYNGWEEYRNGIKEAYVHNQLQAKAIPNDDLKVTRKGDVAWTTVTFHFTATMADNAKKYFVARHTTIWEKRGDGWIVVHEHVSIPVPGL